MARDLSLAGRDRPVADFGAVVERTSRTREADLQPRESARFRSEHVLWLFDRFNVKSDADAFVIASYH